MSDRDNELDRLLKPMHELEPSSAQMQKWQTLVKNKTSKKYLQVSRTRMFMQLVAAVFIGVIIGSVLMKSLTPEQPSFTLLANNSTSDATFEQSHANLD